MRRRAAERRRLVGLVRGREPWLGDDTVGLLWRWTRPGPDLADRGRRPNLESGAGLGPRFRVSRSRLRPEARSAPQARTSWDRRERHSFAPPSAHAARS